MISVTVPIGNKAFSLAFRILEIGGGLTAEEKAAAPTKLKEYIDALVSSGERDPDKIARSAVCLVREFEQTARSIARRTSSLSVAP